MNTSNPENLTAQYYETHSASFIAETAALDLSTLYPRFLQQVPDHGYILDAGCGSGRDSKAFKDMGYQVLAVDSCPAFVQQTQHFANVPTQQLKFEDFAFEACFDGIWANASLLHLPPEPLQRVLAQLHRALKPTGCIYASFKAGNFSGIRQGRWFTDLDRSGLQRLLPSGLEVFDHWQTPDRRPQRAYEMWFNVLLCPAAKSI